MKREKIVVIVLILAIIFAALSVAISFSIDDSYSAYTQTSGSQSTASAGKIGLEVLPPENSNQQNNGGISE